MTVAQSAGFVGNDVVDLKSPLLDARSGEGGEARSEWASRHLTDAERAAPGSGERFWEIFAAKEAASKAFAQGGVAVAPGAFRDFEVDLAARRVTHRPTGLAGRIARLETTADSVHAVVLYPDGPCGARLATAVESLAAGDCASGAAREVLTGLLARSLGGSRPDRYAVTFDEGRPRVLETGEPMDWSVSLSHSGRFVAACALIP